MFTDELKDYLKREFGDFTPERLTGGYTNETFLLAGTDPLAVVKISKSESTSIVNEIKAMRKVVDTGIAPRIFKMLEHEMNHVTVMEYRQGRNGQAILDSGDLAETKELYKILGHSLAVHIHSKKYDSTAGIKESEMNRLNLNLDFVPERLKAMSSGLLNRVSDQKENWVLTHGDYGIHNVLFTEERSLTVLDWEWSEWGSPLTDIGWVCWFTSLHYPQYAETLNALFIEAYKQHNPIDLSPVLLRSYCGYKVWKILQLVAHASEEVQQEWIRRLEWTLESDLFNEL